MNTLSGANEIKRAHHSDVLKYGSILSSLFSLLRVRRRHSLGAHQLSNAQKITQERNDTQKDLDDAIAQKRQMTQLGNANTHMHRAIEAVHFQATSAHAAETNLDLVEEIMDLVARTGQLTVRTTEATAPALTFASGHHRSTQYVFWLASRIGTAQQVIEEAEGLFNPRQITA